MAMKNVFECELRIGNERWNWVKRGYIVNIARVLRDEPVFNGYKCD
jgi:hypothetical protein